MQHVTHAILDASRRHGCFVVLQLGLAVQRHVVSDSVGKDGDVQVYLARVAIQAFSSVTRDRDVVRQGSAHPISYNLRVHHYVLAVESTKMTLAATGKGRVIVYRLLHSIALQCCEMALICHTRA